MRLLKLFMKQSLRWTDEVKMEDARIDGWRTYTTYFDDFVSRQGLHVFLDSYFLLHCERSWGWGELEVRLQRPRISFLVLLEGDSLCKFFVCGVDV